MKPTLQKLPMDFSVCRLPHPQSADVSQPYTFLSVTDEEVSLVCQSRYVPADATAEEPGWRAFKVSGVLDFSLVGILAGIAEVLANGGISLFAVSTYNTDYILLKEEAFPKALDLLEEAGYPIA